jgi:hypothetical protein
VIMPTHFHAILFDIEFNSERLKHTQDYPAQHLPKSFVEEFHQHAGKDRQRRFWQPTQPPIGIFSDGFWKQKMDHLHHNPCRKGLVLRPEDWRFSSGLYWATREATDEQLSAVAWE